MKKACSVSVLLFAVASQPAFAQGKKPNIVVLAMGGTMGAAAGTQSNYTSGDMGADPMVTAVPGIEYALNNIKGEQISSVAPQDMSFNIMLKLTKRINQLLSAPDVDAIVITHGIDTMEE